MSVDLDLLRKLATGEGGHRTGELKRAGLLRWAVTDEGYRVLGMERPAVPDLVSREVYAKACRDGMDAAAAERAAVVAWLRSDDPVSYAYKSAVAEAIEAGAHHAAAAKEGGDGEP